MNMKKKIIFITLLVSNVLLSQYSNAIVNADLRQIKEGNRYLLNGFEQKIKTYIESTSFASDADDLDLEVSVKLLIQSIQNKGSNYELSIQAIFSNDNNYFYSKKTVLPYSQGFQLINNGQYDPLRSFFDFYLYIFIAMNLDTWEYMGGESYYSKSIDIAKLGEISEFFSGWSTRKNIAEKTKTNRFLRNLRYQFFIALDELISSKPNTKIIKASLQEMNQEINSISKVYGEEKYTIMFLDGYAKDIKVLCDSIGYNELLNNLIFFDKKNRDIYEGNSIGD